MMKIWLNNVKEGDDFYGIINHQIIKCKHLGDAHNRDFKMPMIKCEDENHNIYELFVNQYVYDDYESAEEACIDDLKKELKSIKESIVSHKAVIVNLETREQTLKERISNYERANN